MKDIINGKKILAGVLALSMVCGCVAIPNSEVFGVNNSIVAGAEDLVYGDFKYEILDDDTIDITKYTGSDTSVTIPREINGKKVTAIGAYAFEYCTKLTNIEIPNTITSIGYGTFYNCQKLTNIEIPNSVTYIGAYTFQGTPWLENKRKENPLVIVNGILIDGKTCMGDVVVPNSVTSIGDETFYGCTSLTSIEIPNSVTSIEQCAFYGCESLTSIKIPNSVTYIGAYAFRVTPWLENKRKENPLVIVNRILVDGTNCEGEVTIPNSVISICGGAFHDCTSLTDVYYSGTEEQWNNIYIGEYNDCLTSANIHYNSKMPISIEENNGFYGLSLVNPDGDKECHVGDKITIKLEGNLAEFTSLDWKINYDEEYFKLLESNVDEFVNFLNNLPYVGAYVSNLAKGCMATEKGTNYNGTIVTFTFEVIKADNEESTKSFFIDRAETCVRDANENAHIMTLNNLNVKLAADTGKIPIEDDVFSMGLSHCWGFKNFSANLSVSDYAVFFSPAKAKSFSKSKLYSKADGVCAGMVLTSVAISRYDMLPLKTFENSNGSNPYSLLHDIKDKKCNNNYDIFNISAENFVKWG